MVSDSYFSFQLSYFQAAQGGRGRMHQLFGDGMADVINELNEALSA